MAKVKRLKKQSTKKVAEKPKKKDVEVAEEPELEKLKMVMDGDEDDDSSSSDEEAVSKPNAEDAAAAISKQRKAEKLQKTLRDNAGVIYIGHLPLLFSESDLLQFLSQFGPVRNVRVRRSASTGRSSGFAFCKFRHADTAQTVAETLSGYLIFDAKSNTRKQLVCHAIPPEKVHPALFAQLPRLSRNERQRFVSKRKKGTKEELHKVHQKVKDRDVRKKERILELLGSDAAGYEFPGYTECKVQQGDDKSGDGPSDATKNAEVVSKTSSPKSPTTKQEGSTRTDTAPKDATADNAPESSGKKKKKKKRKSKAAEEEKATPADGVVAAEKSSTPNKFTIEHASSMKESVKSNKKSKLKTPTAATTPKAVETTEETSTAAVATAVETPASSKEKKKKNKKEKPEAATTNNKDDDAPKRKRSDSDAGEASAAATAVSEKKKKKKKKKDKRKTM